MEDHTEENTKLRKETISRGRTISEAVNKRTLEIRSGKLGLCKHCENLNAHETTYGRCSAWCEQYKKRLDPHDPVIRCTKFWSIKYHKLEELISMAWMIDVKRSIGFELAGTCDFE